jgi:hypothetical protein
VGARAATDFAQNAHAKGRGLRMELEAAPRPQADARWRQERPRIVAGGTKNSASQPAPLRDASTP